MAELEKILKEISKTLAEVHDLYDMAETAIKKIEHISEGPGINIPAINELRYAGKHILDAIKGNKISELEEAKDHCIRAIHDVYEVGILLYLKKIKLFQDDYKFVPITKVIPDYIDIKMKVKEIRDFVGENSRQNHIKDKFQTMSKYFDEIKKIYDRCDMSQEELKIFLKRYRIALILTILGLIFALITILQGSNINSNNTKKSNPKKSQQQTLPNSKVTKTNNQKSHNP